VTPACIFSKVALSVFFHKSSSIRTHTHALLTPPLLEADLKLILFPWVSSSVVSNVVAVDFLECSATEY